VPAARSLAGLRVVCFESRRATEIAELVRRYGGEALSAPALRELSLEDAEAVIEFAERLGQRELDLAIFLTGVGTRILVEALVKRGWARERLASALSSMVTVVRGPKPRAALAELGVRPTVTVPEPNTWRELLAAIDAHGFVAGKRVAVQEYGAENPDLMAGLADRGARVLRVPIYRWALPTDLEPLREAIRRLVAGGVDVALFTSATQVEHLFQVAGSEGGALRAALAATVVGSIGPICREALERRGVRVDVEPQHPKMGQLVHAVAERGADLLRTKRRLSR
jgi:uroporphyrinogen-III synthase